MMKIRFLGMIFAVSGLIALFLVLDSRGHQPDDEQSSNALPRGIAWYGVLTDGIADAKATNRPILLLAAAPQCAGVPGMW